MKNILLILLCCLISFSTRAQGAWQIPGYNQHVEIQVSGNSETVTINAGTVSVTYPVHKSGIALKLKNADDNRKILDVLKLDEATIDGRYSDMPESLLPSEKLITKAFQQSDKKIMITAGTDPGDTDSPESVIDGGNELAGGIDGGQANDNGEQPGSLNWIYLGVAGLILIVVTALVTRYVSRPRETTTAPVAEVSAAGPRSTDTKKLKQQIIELQQNSQQLEAEKTALEKQLAAFQTFDKTYFNEAFHRLVAPMGAAVDKGAQTEIVENMMKMAAHFASLTRYKIAKKQNYDEANIRYMLEQKQGVERPIAEITGTTPPDKTPRNIQALIDILKHYQSSGLDDAIISGYKIKNL